MLRNCPMLQFLLSCFLLCVICGNTNARSPSQIAEKLFQNYDKSQAPNLNGPTIAKVGMYIVSINIKDTTSGILQWTLYFRVQWQDPRLAFTPDDGKQASISLPESVWDKLWMPDLFIRETIDSKFHNALTANRMFKLAPDGKMWHAAKLTIETSCDFNIHRFPHDTEKEELTIESFSYTTDTLIIQTLDSPIDLNHRMRIPDFSIVSTSVVNCTTNYTSGTYPCVSFILEFRRQTGHFVFQVFIPSIFLVIVSWISFWIKHEAAVPRLATGLLTLIALAVIGSQSTSRVMSATLLDCWMLGCYTFVFVSLLEYALVSVLLKSRQHRAGFKMLLPSSPEQKNAGQSVVEKSDDSRRTADAEERKAVWVDWFSRILFPVAFIIFNIAYWSVASAAAAAAAAAA